MSDLTMSEEFSPAGTLAAPVDLHGRDLVFTRVYPAPLERVWAAWTRPEHFTRWFGPHGTTIPFCVMDVRPGGEFRFQHRHADGGEVWAEGMYREVAAPGRLVIDVGFGDPEGQRRREGFSPSMRITVTLREHPRGTELTVRHAGVGMDRGESRGWNEGLDRLASLLASY